jgi:hypothetical protein
MPLFGGYFMSSSPDKLKKMKIAPGRASLLSAPDSIICRVIEACTPEVMRAQGFSEELSCRVATFRNKENRQDLQD